MPRGNGTGPMGMGPMTGRGLGFCGGFGRPGYMNPLPGRGFGMGFGRGWWGGGRGWRNMPGWSSFGVFEPPKTNPDPEMEKQALKNQEQWLQTELEEISKLLDKLEQKDKKK